MRKYIAVGVSVFTLSAPASAQVIDTELLSDRHAYGHTVSYELSCGMEMIASAPGEETYYIRNERVAVVIRNDSLVAYIETYSDELLTGEYWFPPTDESVMWKILDQVFDSRDTPHYLKLIAGTAYCP